MFCSPSLRYVPGLYHNLSSFVHSSLGGQMVDRFRDQTYPGNATLGPGNNTALFPSRLWAIKVLLQQSFPKRVLINHPVNSIEHS